MTSSSPPSSSSSLKLLFQPHTKSLPTTLSRSYKIKNVETDIYVQLFADRILVGVSQMDSKIGNWVLCQASPSPIDLKTIDWEFSTLLGNREDSLLTVYARQITQQLLQLHSSPNALNKFELLLGISIQGRDPEMFRLVVKVIVELIQEANQFRNNK